MSLAPASNFMFFLRGVCLATGAALHIAPIPTMNEIKERRSTLNFHIAPYASTLLNHCINGYYAFIRRDTALMVHRTLGIIANSYYVYTYLSFVPTARLPDSQRWLTRVASIFLGFMLELHLLLPLMGMETSFFSHLAFFAALTGVGLAASPLATVSEVIRNKDSSSLPASLCAMVTIQCTSWTIYGYLVGDWSTFANNIVGVVLGSIQLLLIAIFPNRRAMKKGSDRSKEDGAATPTIAGPDADADLRLDAESAAVQASTSSSS